ncbi:alpha/beta hydrolase [uncultured Sulfitobacter sp.]|uniref:alpha/beta fold hydrolase n=1 Tax=uncultured Sulfitobacter sp. TaxID=191468 RepID=UPI002595AFCF|nr:alpha/beta hydrolase [uncultured Sulfitobacter sp.]
MAFFDYDGNQIYYVDHGTGKAIVLLHGITNSGRAWLEQLPLLVGLGYRVIIPDFVGHGSSSIAQRVTSPRDIANCVLALLASLNIQNADFCGLSLGGAVAIEAATIQPSIVDRLVISNSFATMKSDAMAAMVEGWKKVFLQPYGPVLRLEATWPVLVSQEFRDSPQGSATFLIWHAQAAKADGQSYCNIADGLLQYDAREKLADIKQQTLVISSDNDKISPVANSLAIAEGIKNAVHFTIENSEHISNVDSASAFNQLLSDFLTGAG